MDQLSRAASHDEQRQPAVALSQAWAAVSATERGYVFGLGWYLFSGMLSIQDAQVGLPQLARLLQCNTLYGAEPKAWRDTGTHGHWGMRKTGLGASQHSRAAAASRQQRRRRGRALGRVSHCVCVLGRCNKDGTEEWAADAGARPLPTAMLMAVVIVMGARKRASKREQADQTRVE